MRKPIWLVLVAIAALAAVAGFWTAQQLREPAITTVSQNIGSTLGGMPFLIHGSGFNRQGQTRVLVGESEATKVEVLDAHSITAIAPAGSNGYASITVINPNGRRTTHERGYLYNQAKPEITSVSPTTLKAAGGEIITVTGTGFIAGKVELHFDDAMIPSTLVNETTIQFVAPPARHPLPTDANVSVVTTDDAWSSDETSVHYR